MLELPFEEISFQEFCEELFGDISQTAVFAVGGEKHSVFHKTVAELDESDVHQEECYIYASSFFNNYPRFELMKNLFAFVVDIDAVSDYGVDRIKQLAEMNIQFAPTIVVASGSGVHLYYVFKTPVEVRKRWTKVLKEMNRSLYKWWADQELLGGVVDIHSATIPHAFRVPGSLTKSKEIVKAYRLPLSRRVEVIELADSLGVSREIYGGSKTTFEVVANEEIDRHRREKSNKYQNKKKTFGTRHRGLYDFTLREIQNKTLVGNRYLATYCLASLAWVCGIEEQEVRNDIEFLVNKYWPTKYRDRLNKHDIECAMKGYNSERARLRRETREEYLGWRYEGKKPKRNKGDKHKTRKENMHYVNEKRKANAMLKVAMAISSNPECNKSQIAKISGLDRKTVRKYWEAGKALADKL